MFSIYVSIDIVHVFLDYRPYSGNDDIGEKSIIEIARLDALVGTVLACLEQRK